MNEYIELSMFYFSGTVHVDTRLMLSITSKWVKSATYQRTGLLDIAKHCNLVAYSA